MVARLATKPTAPPPRAPERAALAAALQKYSEVLLALAENETAGMRLGAGAAPTRRPPRKRRLALNDLDAVTRNNVRELTAKGLSYEQIEAQLGGIELFRDPTPEEILEEARQADAAARAAGRPATALQDARRELQEAQDTVDTTAAARELLRRERARLEGQLADSTAAINRVVAEVCKSEPAIVTLVEQFVAARARFAELYGVLSAASVPLGPNTSISGLPSTAGEWGDLSSILNTRAESATAAKVQDFITALRTNADAVLELPK